MSNCHTRLQNPVRCENLLNINCFTMKFHNCHRPITWNIRIINNKSLGLLFACAWTFVFEAVSTFVVTFRTTFFCSQTGIAFDRYPTTASRWICWFYCSLRMCRSGKSKELFSLDTSSHVYIRCKRHKIMTKKVKNISFYFENQTQKNMLRPLSDVFTVGWGSFW